MDPQLHVVRHVQPTVLDAPVQGQPGLGGHVAAPSPAVAVHEPVQENRGEHELGQHVGAGQVLQKLVPRQLAAPADPLRRLRTVPRLGVGSVLPPPNKGDPPHEAVDHLQVIRQLHGVERQHKGGDHTRVQQRHGVEDAEADQRAEREGCSQERPHLPSAGLSASQDHLHRSGVAVGEAAGHNEREAETGLQIEDPHGQVQELGLDAVRVSDGGLRRDEE
mmetsp:Transcript_102815/g.317193  ORF Transcript_102815/g.317193 Transcript_102815/m.317193 type:complete len:220 (+) Transcript_102815:816-1475(+)